MLLYYLIMVLPITAMISLLVYLPICLINRKKYGKRPFIRHLAIYAFIGIILSVLYATIFIYGFDITSNSEYRFLNLVPFIWVKETYAMGINKMIEQLLMNIIMIVPLGFIVPVVFKSLRKWWKTGINVMVFITCIEILQYFIGRSADVDDLIMNTFGGLIGYVLMAVFNKCFKNKAWWQKALNNEQL
jgi:glycopeptide antibiotics resistance protein